MPITRRQMLAVALTASAWRSKAYAAEQDQAVFWRVTMPGRNENFLFGNLRFAASLVPDIVSDGKKLIDETQRFVVTFPNIQMPSSEAKNEDLPPVWKELSKPVADELRPILSRIPDAGSLPGIAVVFLLLGEGQTPTSVDNPTVGDELARYAVSLGRQLISLLSEEEVRAHWRQPDLVALNQQIDEPKIAYLLALRRRVGPIGSHLGQLYHARRVDEIIRINAEIDHQGIPTFTQSLESLLGPLLDRLTRLLDTADTPSALVSLPLDLLMREPDMLARLRADGYAVTPVP